MTERPKIESQYDHDDVDEILRRYQPAVAPAHPILDTVSAFLSTLDSTLEPDDWARTYFVSYVDGAKAKAIVGHALRDAGVSRKEYTRRMAEDGMFAALQQEANMLWIEAIEFELHHRLLHGTAKPIVARGRIIEYAREMSDALLMWSLERMVPEKYHLPTRTEEKSKDAPTKFKFAMGEAPAELGAGNETRGK